MRTIEFPPITLLIFIVFNYLRSDIDVDDVARYINSLQDGTYDWDIAHLWAQPLALLLLKSGYFGSDARWILEQLNIVATSLGIGIFYIALRVGGVDFIAALIGSMAAALSFNILALAPTAHIKLLCLPGLAAGLLFGSRWEARVTAGRGSGQGVIVMAFMAGASLGLGALFLVSLVPIGIAMLIAGVVIWVRHGKPQSRRSGVLSLLAFAAASLGIGVLGIVAAHALAVATASTERGVVDFVLMGVADKYDLHPGFHGSLDAVARIFFSSVFNFIFLDNLGAIGRALMWGVAARSYETIGFVALDALIFGTIGVFLIAASLNGLSDVIKVKQPLIMFYGMIAGALTFSVYQNLNDPEHWFQLTMPIIAIVLQQTNMHIRKLFLFGVAPIIIMNNLVMYGLPKAHFDREGAETEVRSTIGEAGLLVGYAGYPGRPDTSLLELDGIERFRIDVELRRQDGDIDAVIVALEDRIDAALNRGGATVVFRLFDLNDWHAPFMSLELEGLRRERLISELRSRYVIEALGLVGGVSAWQVVGRLDDHAT